MSNQTYIIILRLLHIGFGVFWAGSAISFAFFIGPAVKASGPEGIKFMQQLGKSKYPIIIMIAALITIISGILLIEKLSGGFQSAWFTTDYSRIITTGGTLAIIAFIIGFTVNRPAAARINAISNDIAKAGGPPSSEQVQQLTKMRKRLAVGTNYITVLLVLTIIAMSIFRYIS
jgi:uncharacterized membrane protein